MQTIVLHFGYFVLILLFSTAYNTSLIYCFVIWCLHTNKRRPCSSTLSGHPSSSSKFSICFSQVFHLFFPSVPSVFHLFFPSFPKFSIIFHHFFQVFHLFFPSVPSVFSQVFHHFSSLFPSFPSVFPKFSQVFHHFSSLFPSFPSVFLMFSIIFHHFSHQFLPGIAFRRLQARRAPGVGSAESTSAPLRRRGFGEVGKAVKAGCAWRNGWDRMI